MGVVEVQGDLKKSGSVVLDAAGNGVIIFDPDHANQRWVVRSVVVSTNQPATASSVPVAQVALNTVQVTTLSQGNDYGASWSGNREIFRGQMDVGPCDFLSILFYPAPGASGTPLVGVQARAVLTGDKYSRKATR